MKWALVAALVFGACASDGDEAGDGGGGSGAISGTAGVGGAGGASGAAGVGGVSGAGAGAGADCNETLEQYCKRGRRCPSSANEARALVCSDRRWGAGEETNTCGGTTVRYGNWSFGSLYHYDGSDRLVGITQYDDVPQPPCDTDERTWGRGCARDLRFCKQDCKVLACDKGDDAGTDDDAGG